MTEKLLTGTLSLNTNKQTILDCFEIIAYYSQANTNFSKIGKYFADFNFRGLILTAKFRENWTTRKIPVLRYGENVYICITKNHLVD